MRKPGKHTKRLILILAGVIFAMIVSWRAAFLPTLKLWRDGKQAESQLAMINQAPYQMVQLREQIKQRDLLFGNGAVTDPDDIVSAVSEYLAENKQPVLCAIPPVHESENKDYLIRTFVVELQGSFSQLVRFLNYFELHRKLGKFSSAEFYTVIDRANKRKELHLKILIQSYIKK